MRRNRDPQLNERVHRVRALQSTLKVSWRALGMVKDWALGFRLWVLALSSGLSCGLAKFWVPRARLPVKGSVLDRARCWVLSTGLQS